MYISTGPFRIPAFDVLEKALMGWDEFVTTMVAFADSGAASAASTDELAHYDIGKLCTSTNNGWSVSTNNGHGIACSVWWDAPVGLHKVVVRPLGMAVSANIPGTSRIVQAAAKLGALVDVEKSVGVRVPNGALLFPALYRQPLGLRGIHPARITTGPARTDKGITFALYDSRDPDKALNVKNVVVDGSTVEVVFGAMFASAPVAVAQITRHGSTRVYLQTQSTSTAGAVFRIIDANNAPATMPVSTRFALMFGGYTA